MDSDLRNESIEYTGTTSFQGFFRCQNNDTSYTSIQRIEEICGTNQGGMTISIVVRTSYSQIYYQNMTEMMLEGQDRVADQYESRTNEG